MFFFFLKKDWSVFCKKIIFLLKIIFTNEIDLDFNPFVNKMIKVLSSIKVIKTNLIVNKIELNFFYR